MPGMCVLPTLLLQRGASWSVEDSCYLSEPKSAPKAFTKALKPPEGGTEGSPKGPEGPNGPEGKPEDK
jgi:hypothetical protein